jgi:hypothetical protein
MNRVSTSARFFWLHACAWLLLGAWLITAMPAQAASLSPTCDNGGNPYNANNEPLAHYMCQVVAQNPGVRLFFEYGNAGSKTGYDNLNERPVDQAYSASMTKIITTFMAIEMLIKNSAQAGSYNATNNYNKRDLVGINLDTIVRIVPDRNNLPNNSNYSRQNIIYVSKGFATSTCSGMPNGAFGIDRFNAKFAIYEPERGYRYQYTIRQLIGLAMVKSFNDAAVMLGALTAYSLGVPNVLDVTQQDINAHRWIPQFASYMNNTGRALGASSRTTFCSPPGWGATGSFGCNQVGTAQDWATMSREVYRRLQAVFPVVKIPGTNSSYTKFFSLASVGPVLTRARDKNGVCRTTSVSGSNTAGGLLSGAGMTTDASLSVGGIAALSGPIKLVKTGSINGPENLTAVAEPVDTKEGCSGAVMTATVMGLCKSTPCKGKRQTIVGNMLKLGRLQFTAANASGACTSLDYNQALADQTEAISNAPFMNEVDRSVLEASYETFETDDRNILTKVLPEPEGYGDGSGGNEGGGTYPDSSVSNSMSEADCDEGLMLAEDMGREAATTARLAISDKLLGVGATQGAANAVGQYGGSLVEQIYSQQCFGKFIKLAYDVSEAVDNIRQLSSAGDIIGAAVSAAASAVVRSIMEQLFQSLTNAICNTTSAITNSIDNVSKNLLCVKSPLFGISNRPFDVNLDLDSISCSGISINPLYFSGAPGEQLVNGGEFANDINNAIPRTYCKSGERLTRNKQNQFVCIPEAPATLDNMPRVSCQFGRQQGWLDVNGDCRITSDGV